MPLTDEPCQGCKRPVDASQLPNNEPDGPARLKDHSKEVIGGRPPGPVSCNIMGLENNEVVIATYSIVIDVEVMEKSGHIIKKVTYPDVMLPFTIASVLRDAAESEEL